MVEGLNPRALNPKRLVHKQLKQATERAADLLGRAEEAEGRASQLEKRWAWI